MTRPVLGLYKVFELLLCWSGLNGTYVTEYMLSKRRHDSICGTKYMMSQTVSLNNVCRVLNSFLACKDKGNNLRH